jgi:hypothetical protein
MEVFLTLIIYLTMLSFSFANPMEKILQWDYNPETNISGYKLYDITNTRTLVLVTEFNSATISTYGGTIYAVTAYNTFELESLLSNSVTIPYPLSQSGYGIVDCNSTLRGYEPIFAIDGIPTTYWSTNIVDPSSKFPYILIIRIY